MSFAALPGVPAFARDDPISRTSRLDLLPSVRMSNGPIMNRLSFRSSFFSAFTVGARPEIMRRSSLLVSIIAAGGFLLFSPAMGNYCITRSCLLLMALLSPLSRPCEYADRCLPESAFKAGVIIARIARRTSLAPLLIESSRSGGGFPRCPLRHRAGNWTGDYGKLSALLINDARKTCRPRRHGLRKNNELVFPPAENNRIK